MSETPNNQEILKKINELFLTVNSSKKLTKAEYNFTIKKLCEVIESLETK